ncbi:MAG: ABC transporter substrate-binding protein [Synergistaceae bacterium]|nr:ABC transporter substrate-binding protein [Synergistaceae bacterium]
MNKKAVTILMFLLLLITVILPLQKIFASEQTQKIEQVKLRVAVEYTNHAASFYYAESKKMFQQAGIEIEEAKIYASGVAVAVAFTKEDFDAGYMCLVPAIFTYANGGVPLKIIAGTHKNGYALVVRSSKIKKLKDLESKGIKIANGPKGTSTDFLQMIMIRDKNLSAEKVLSNTVRMNTTKQLMALFAGKVDAIFVPEHFATLALAFPGIKTLLRSEDIWPDMQGSVLVVAERLLKSDPATVKKLYEINKISLKGINDNPRHAAVIIAEKLNINQEKIKIETKSPNSRIEVNSDIVLESIKNMNMTEEISVDEVQKVIDEMFELGYLSKSFKAEEIMASR